MKKFLIAMSLAVAATGAFAQATLKVSTGSASGTYSRMFKELSATCKNELPLVEVNSTGSVQNIDRLIGNEVNGAFTQTDVIFFRGQTEELGDYKTLVSLHPEEVHVVTRTVSPIVEGGTMGFGKKPIELNRVEDLAGRTVAAYGGSFVTAQVVRLQSEIQYKVVEVQNFKDAKAALDAGQVAAILMVGGAKLGDIETLDRNYKLLPFSEQTIGKLKRVYVPATLNYSNLGSGGNGIKTVATEALLVVRAYKSPKFVEAMASLRKCFNDNVETISETTGMHAKWRLVKPGNEGKWGYYQLPTAKK